jgi:hypothetical protein
LIASARPKFVAAQDAQGLAICDLADALIDTMRLRRDDAHRAAASAASRAAASRSKPFLNTALEWKMFTALWASLPLTEVRETLLRAAAEAPGAWPSHSTAYFEACIAILERGYSPTTPEIARYVELLSMGRGDEKPSVQLVWARLALIGGDAVTANALTVEAAAAHAANGNDNQRQTAEAFAAEACAILGDLEGATRHALQAEQVGEFDLAVQAAAMRARARVALQRGDTDGAARLADRLMVSAELTQSWDEKADALVIAANVRQATGATDGARQLLIRARLHVSSKGATAAVHRIDRDLSAL